MADPRLYEFTCNISALVSNLASQLANDVHWKVVNRGNVYSNWGTVTFENKYDPNLYFTMAIQQHSDGVSIRWGLFNNGQTIKPDCYTDSPHGVITETPFHQYTGNSYDITYKWKIVTTTDAVVIIGEYQSHTNVAYPVRIYMGRLDPLEPEDPAIANDFVGIFPHMPMGVSDSNGARYVYYNVGRGIVRKSRNGSKWEFYHFSNDSNLVSPGIGGRYFVTPFMVFHPLEGVRGSFKGVKSIIFKNPSAHPHWSILDLGEKKYRVLHVQDQAPPTSNDGYYYEISNGNWRYCRPYWFDSNMVFGGGQRALLFEV